MKKYIQKVILSFISLTILSLSLLTPFAQAQGNSPTTDSSNEFTWYNQPFTDWYAKVYSMDNQSEIFGERYTAAQVQWIVYGLVSLPINFFGSRVGGIISCILEAGSTGLNPVDDTVCMGKLGVYLVEVLTPLGFITNAVTDTSINEQDTTAQNIYNSLLQNPVSGVGYVIRGINRFTTVPVANAQTQGFGFTAVNGLQKYWQGFRNMAYAIAVFVIVIFAFMIMFRVKISPQVVISVQSAIPKVAGALILATFSYAIAGFVIDLSYVVGGLLASLMTLAGFALNFTDAWNFIVPTGATTALGGFYILAYMFGYTILFFFAAVLTLGGTISGLSVFGFIGSFLMIIMTVVVLLAMLWYTIKIPWVLLKTLISLFLSIVVGPVQIMVGVVVPSIGFGMWLKKIIAEALVFPITGLFMFLAWKTLFASMAASLGQTVIGPILSGLNIISDNQNLWAPPILGSSADMAGILWLAVSFTFILMIPQAVGITKMLIMGEKFAFGTGIGEAVGPLGIGVGAYASTHLREGSVPPYIDRIPGVGPWLSRRDEDTRRRMGNFLDTVLRSIK